MCCTCCLRGQGREAAWDAVGSPTNAELLVLAAAHAC